MGPPSPPAGSFAGAIAALYKDGAVYHMVDASYVTTTAEKIANGRVDTQRKPWSLRKDGDLWSIFQDAFHAKGGKTKVWIEKVKAHLTEEDVRHGKIDRDHWEGNKRADEEAKLAIHCHPEKLRNFAAVQAKRAEAYRVLVRAIQLVIFQVDQAVAKAIKAEDKVGHIRTGRAAIRRKASCQYRPLPWAEIGRAHV